jgi:hypothetical protein
MRLCEGYKIIGLRLPLAQSNTTFSASVERTEGTQSRLKEEWSEQGMNDIEGKAVRETATERGREGVSIMKYEVDQSSLSPTVADLIFC